MNCRICGAELARDGELCNNCMNKLMAEQALRNDVEECYSFKRKFVLGYEILRHAEQICIVIFMIVLMLSINFSYWKYALLTALVFSVFGIFYLWYLQVEKCQILQRSLSAKTSRILWRQVVRTLTMSLWTAHQLELQSMQKLSHQNVMVLS